MTGPGREPGSGGSGRPERDGPAGADGAGRPPRLARWLLARILPAADRNAILSELDEFHARRVRDVGRARAWYWRQVLSYATRRSQLRSPGPAHRWRSGSGIVRDLRWAVRSLGRTPAATVPAVLTIGLALGVNAAVFAVVDGILLAPLPYDDAGELVRVWMADPGDGADEPGKVSGNAWSSWNERAHTVAGVGLYDVWRATLIGVGDPQDVMVTDVQPALLNRLGIHTVLGRSFAPDESDDRTPVIVLSHAFWRSRLGSDSAVVGRTLRLAGTDRVVIGVAAPGFRLPLDRDVMGWSPFGSTFAGPRFLHDVPEFEAIAWRRPDGPGLAVIRGELEPLIPEPVPASQGGYPARYLATHVRAAPLEDLTRPAGSALPVLMGAVTLVLLLACANVAQLLLARGLARKQELAVRLALGAGPGALGRMLAIEGAAVAGAGALLAAGFAQVILRVFLSVDPGQLPGWADVRLTPRVGIYLALAAAVAAVVTGLAPALRGARGPSPLNLHARGSSGDAGSFRIQRSLLAAQTALTLILLASMATLVRSWIEVQTVDPGFVAADVHTARIVLPFNRYNPGDGALHRTFFERLHRSLADRPEIADVTVATGLPALPSLDFTPQFRPRDGSQPPRPVTERLIGPDYFETLRIPVLAGRTPAVGDDSNAESVAVLNLSAARLLLGTDDPAAAVGSQLIEGSDGTGDPVRVIGVVSDVREAGPDHAAEPRIYEPYLQSRPFGRMWIAVRPTQPGDTVWAAIRAALADVDPELPLVDAGPLTRAVATTLSARRFSLFLMTALGALALVIAVVGMAGLAAFSASRFRRQVAIRVALGAGPARALAPAVGGQLFAVAAGLVIGLAGVALTGRALRSLVFGITTLDPSSVSVAVALLAAAGLFATAVPALRAGLGEPREILDG